MFIWGEDITGRKTALAYALSGEHIWNVLKSVEVSMAKAKWTKGKEVKDEVKEAIMEWEVWGVQIM